MIGVGTWFNHLSLRKTLSFSGAPCPEVPEVTAAGKGVHPPPPFTYMGVRFAMQIGNVDCSAVPDDGWFPQTDHPVCQFSGPGAVEVRAPARSVVYQPGVGHPATITVKNGHPSCVVAGTFRF
jgi:hypothetical protein